MARRRRTRNANPFAQWGYPSEAELRREARQLAVSSLPSVGGIRRQYAQAQGDVGGFTRSLVDLLRQQGKDTAGTYSDADAQQKAITDTATARLSALAPGYEGAAAAAGAIGDSAASALNARGAAAQDFAGAQPGIAGNRGALLATGLTNAQIDAMKAHADAFRSAYAQAHQQVSAQALAAAQAASSLNLQQQQLALQARGQAFAEAQALAGTAKDTAAARKELRQNAFQFAEAAATGQVGLPNPSYDPADKSSPKTIPFSPLQAYQHLIGLGAPRRIALAALKQFYSTQEIKQLMAALYTPPKPSGGAAGLSHGAGLPAYTGGDLGGSSGYQTPDYGDLTGIRLTR
jgi:hypothetical protein